MESKRPDQAAPATPPVWAEPDKDGLLDILAEAKRAVVRLRLQGIETPLEFGHLAMSTQEPAHIRQLVGRRKTALKKALGTLDRSWREMSAVCRRVKELHVPPTIDPSTGPSEHVLSVATRNHALRTHAQDAAARLDGLLARNFSCSRKRSGAALVVAAHDCLEPPRKRRRHDVSTTAASEKETLAGILESIASLGGNFRSSWVVTPPAIERGRERLLRVSWSTKLQALILLRGKQALTPAVINVRGQAERGKLWQRSAFDVFRRITDFATEAMAHFVARYEQAALLHLLLWLSQYHKLFQRSCSVCDRWIDYDAASASMQPPCLWSYATGSVMHPRCHARALAKEAALAGHVAPAGGRDDTPAAASSAGGGAAAVDGAAVGGSA